MVGWERGQVPAHSAAQLMPDKTEQYKASTFMYKIIDCLLVKINISYMNITPPPNFVR